MAKKPKRELTEEQIRDIEVAAYSRGQESIRKLFRALLDDVGCPSVDAHEQHYHDGD